MTGKTSTRYGAKLVDEHRAHNPTEVKRTDGYEGRIPNTTDGISEARRRAWLWLVTVRGAR